MSGIDYSKWDALRDSDDSDSGDDAAGCPRVTRLEYPSRVILGPNGVHMESTPPLASASPFHPSSSKTEEVTIATNPTALPKPTMDKVTDQMEEDEMMFSNFTRNGGREGDSHLWSQTRETATVCFIMPNMQIRGKDIHHFQLRCEEQTDRTTRCVISFAIGSDVRVSVSRYVLRYPVRIGEEINAGCWQLHSLPTKSMRLMVVQLLKEPVALGASLWWDRCFATDSLIVDTTKIPERNGGAAERAEAFQKAWTQAHEEFKRQMKEKHAPHVIDDD